MSATKDARRPDAPDHAGVAFHPPVLLGVMIGLGFFARWLLPLSFLPPTLALWLGPFVTVAAFGLFFAAIFTMRTGKATIPTSQPTDNIVVRGPFRFTRNPIYLSMMLLQIGVGIWANSLWFWVLAPVFAIIMWWGVISREERYLERKFGGQFTAYKGRVRRWL